MTRGDAGFRNGRACYWLCAMSGATVFAFAGAAITQHLDDISTFGTVVLIGLLASVGLAGGVVIAHWLAD